METTALLPVRQMRPDEATKGALLSKSVGWGQNLATWQRMIEWSGQGAFCISDGEQVVASTMALIYGPELAWIGLVITNPDYQGRGLARRAMSAAMDYLQAHDIRSVMLDASPFGYPLYEKIGFRPLYKMEIWGGTAPTGISPADGVRPVQEGDYRQIAAIDARLFGFNREHILRRASEFGWVTVENGAVSGYLLGERTTQNVRIGTWYHPNEAGARALFQTALSGLPGETLRLDIPEPNEAAKAIAAAFGLETPRFCTRMVYGGDAPGDMAAQYSISSFSTG